MTETKRKSECSVVLCFKCQLGMLCRAGSSLRQAAVKHVRIVYICLRFYPGRLLIKKPLGGGVRKSVNLFPSLEQRSSSDISDHWVALTFRLK